MITQTKPNFNIMGCQPNYRKSILDKIYKETCVLRKNHFPLLAKDIFIFAGPKEFDEISNNFYGRYPARDSEGVFRLLGCPVFRIEISDYLEVLPNLP